MFSIFIFVLTDFSIEHVAYYYVVICVRASYYAIRPPLPHTPWPSPPLLTSLRPLCQTPVAISTFVEQPPSAKHPWPSSPLLTSLPLPNTPLPSPPLLTRLIPLYHVSLPFPPVLTRLSSPLPHPLTISTFTSHSNNYSSVFG